MHPTESYAGRPRWRIWRNGLELSFQASGEQNSRNVLGMTICLHKTSAMDPVDLLGFLVSKNEDLYKRLWRAFRCKVQGEVKLPTIGVDNRSLEANKYRNCFVNYSFGNIPMHVHSQHVKSLLRSRESRKLACFRDQGGQRYAGRRHIRGHKRSY